MNKLNLDKPEQYTPDHVAWSTIRNSFGGDGTTWPSIWSMVGHPRPVPGGALFTVRVPSRRLGRSFYQIMSWAFDGTVDIVKVGEDPAMYAKAQEARAAIELIAQSLREAVTGEGSE